LRLTPHSSLLTLLLLCCSARADIQLAWEARFNHGLPARTNQVIDMVMSPDGQLVIASTQQGAGGDLDYSLVKYATDGTRLWSVLYNAGPGSNDALRAMALDPAGNVYVTGTSKTVKYSSAGLLQWIAPYGGRAVAVDSNQFAHVVGFATNDFATVKLAPNGTNVWLRTWGRNGQDIATAITVNPTGEVFVAGVVTKNCDQLGCYVEFGLIKYDANGNLIWEVPYFAPPDLRHRLGTVRPSEVRRLILAGNEGIYLVGNFDGGSAAPYVTGLFDATGSNQWYFAFPQDDEGMTSMLVGPSGDLFMTGRLWSGNPAYRIYCRTIALGTNGTLRWTTNFDTLTQSHHRGNGIAMDPSGNVFVAGQTSPTYLQPNFDFLLLKYDRDGRQQWVHRYSGTTNGQDIATSLIRGADGALYVAGHSANTNAGTDITLLKYVEVPNTIEWQGDRVRLNFCGTPATSYRILASTNLTDWDPIATVLSDANGLYGYTDTNVFLHRYRFYRTVTP
jgi:hypothetical protein